MVLGSSEEARSTERQIQGLVRVMRAGGTGHTQLEGLVTGCWRCLSEMKGLRAQVELCSSHVSTLIGPLDMISASHRARIPRSWT